MISVILSGAKDLALVAGVLCGVGPRSFASLRTTEGGDSKWARHAQHHGKTVILSGAKGLALVAKTLRGVGARSFALLRTTEGDDAT